MCPLCAPCGVGWAGSRSGCVVRGRLGGHDTAGGRARRSRQSNRLFGALSRSSLYRRAVGILSGLGSTHLVPSSPVQSPRPRPSRMWCRAASSSRRGRGSRKWTRWAHCARADRGDRSPRARGAPPLAARPEVNFFRMVIGFHVRRRIQLWPFGTHAHPTISRSLPPSDYEAILSIFLSCIRRRPGLAPPAPCR